jgi:ADP-ribose pyrophosphatase
MPFEKMNSEIVYQGRVFDVRKDQVRLPDGRVVQIDLIEHRGAVTIVPLDSDGQIWFIRQYRHPANQELLELPAGVMDEGEAPEISALRELREEIGMAARKLRRIGEFFLAPGYSTEYMYVYLAEDLYPSPLSPDLDEVIQIEKTPIDQVGSLIINGQVQDAKSLASLFLFTLSRK